MNIKIDSEFKKLIPPLTVDEYKGLERSIMNEGVRDSIILWDGLIVDGHNRYEISQKHNIECLSKDMIFTDRDDVMLWIIRNQFGRRNLSPLQRSELALKMEPLIKAKAKENQIRKPESVMQKSAQQKINTREELAKIAGVSHDTISKVKKINESNNQEVKDKVQSGEMSINKGYQELKKPVNINSEEFEEVFVEETKSFEKDKLKQIDNMIIDELYKTIERRLKRTKSKREVKRVLLAIIKKLSIWVEQL